MTQKSCLPSDETATGKAKDKPKPTAPPNGLYHARTTPELLKCPEKEKMELKQLQNTCYNALPSAATRASHSLDRKQKNSFFFCHFLFPLFFLKKGKNAGQRSE